MKLNWIIVVGLLGLTLSWQSLQAQQLAQLTGVVTDATTGESLIGANVIIKGTSKGAATGIDGDYRITSINPSTVILRVLYLGYQEKEITVDLKPGPNVLDIELVYDIIAGEEIVVSAQASGQAAAINQQINANTIVNVVSQDRIQALPDQNAAESVGRLPGISLQRDGGEGQKVIVRGLSPKFNSITINGERIPATDAADRSVDLSMISPDLLAGIEVFKSLTPDLEADAIGGTVNLVVRKAPEGFQGNGRFQGGYNDLMNEYGQYRWNAMVSNRFFNNKLGVIAGANYQRANRSFDGLEGDYLPDDTDSTILVLNANLSDQIEIRDRYGANLTLDYDLGNGEIQLRSFYSRTDRDELRRRLRYRVANSEVERDLRNRNRFSALISNALSGRHQWNRSEWNWQVSYARTLFKTPTSTFARFRQPSAFPLGANEEQGIDTVVARANLDIEDTHLNLVREENSRGVDADLNFSTDYRIDVSMGDRVNGFIKVGGRYREKNRVQDINQYEVRGVWGEVQSRARDLGYQFQPGTIFIDIDNFLDPGFSTAQFLEGRFNFGPGLATSPIRGFSNDMNDFFRLNLLAELRDFDASETVAAGFLMSQMNFGTRLMMVGGFRYEHTSNSYQGVYSTENLTGDVANDNPTGSDDIASRVLRDTTGGRDYGRLFPSVQIRYKFTERFDVRVAATRSLSRPNYYDLVPFENINDQDQIITRGNPDLNPTTSWNYDAFLTYYNNSILFSVGGYYKSLRDIQFFSIGVDPETNFQLLTPLNTDEGTLYGTEIDLQTNFSFLPGFLSGIILNMNYSYTYSETQVTELVTNFIDHPIFGRIIDGNNPYTATKRSIPLPDQSDHVFNLTFGYELGGFSGRASMSYQGEFISGVGQLAILDTYARSFNIWDIAITQKIPRVKGLQLLANLNNINNRPQQSFLGNRRRDTFVQFYGWTFDLGLKYKF